jgi:hypothetical protein
MRIDLISMWHNEEFLAPFFFNHYRFVDRIHIVMGSDTTDNTRLRIDEANKKHKNIQIHEFEFPGQKMDDLIKAEKLNSMYREMDGNYVFIVDSDEFIFYPEGYLDSHPDIIHFVKFWTVYRHHTEGDLNPDIPIRLQRRHGVSNYVGYDLYTKPSIIKAGQNFVLKPGNHSGYLNGEHVFWKKDKRAFPLFWKKRKRDFPPGVSRGEPLTGSHWGMADLSFAIQRYIVGRKNRQSDVNIKNKLAIQYQTFTEEYIRKLMKEHENDPQVF